VNVGRVASKGTPRGLHLASVSAQPLLVIGGTLLVPALYRRSPRLRAALVRRRWSFFRFGVASVVVFALAVMSDMGSGILVVPGVAVAVFSVLTLDAFVEYTEEAEPDAPSGALRLVEEREQVAVELRDRAFVVERERAHLEA
jgi:hypothetical protein